MAKKVYIKNAKDLEGFLANTIANNLFFKSNLQDKAAEIMQERIIENVYNAYEPTEYERRGNDEGFSDMNNMQFTSVDVKNGNVRFVFENTTEGNDSMSGEEMTETFEKGLRDNWLYPDATDEYGRVVSAPRPFIDDSINDMNSRKGELIDAVRKDLRNLGFDAK